MDAAPGDGQAGRLKRWWALGEGRARWIGSPTPFRTLRAMLLSKGVPKRQVDGLTANIMKLATGRYPGQRDRHDADPLH